MDEKIPMPPQQQLFVPLNFWLDIIAYLDKKTEIICNSSGHGMISMTIKIHKSRIHEVTFEEKLRVRDVVKKAGAVGSAMLDKEPPITDAEGLDEV